MLYITGALGAVAGMLAVGAVHLEVASGNDLLGPALRENATVASATVKSNSTSYTVNRPAKGDRDASIQATGGTTLSFMVPGASDQSVMVRLPTAANDSQKSPITFGSNRPAMSARPVACEPVVSVLTAIAKQLEPGRCVT